MKKFIIAVAFSLISLGLSSQDWAVGLRVGAVTEAVGQYHMGDTYIEARFGASFVNNFMRDGWSVRPDYNTSADFTVLYNWKLMSWDWSPSVGTWFFDAGAGINVGGAEHFAYVGLAGMARFGIEFGDVPIALSLDWTPAISMSMIYFNEGNQHFTEAGYNGLALANIAITCVFYL